ncbi:hypothetical protein GCM10009069_27590 [Algimonas arctica]|uniref:AlpA family phage regulatory protein n=1 Tax=Algimonas arctica TaxID=1479486 RepID=A0A8J3G396_9PROT|nr:hypothetical protein GCM10009069_27590 [Algimonas arctica]
MDEKYLNTKEAYVRMNISRSTFYRYRKDNPNFPRPLKLSESCMRYKLSDITRYCDSTQGGPESSKGQHHV